MRITAATSTDLFVGTEANPEQVVQVSVANDGGEPLAGLAVRVEGPGASTPWPVLADLAPGEERTVEVGVSLDEGHPSGASLRAEAVAERDGESARLPVEVVVAEPGWRMFMVSHFHYDPVWWHTQAAYTETWEKLPRDERPWEGRRQHPAFTLIEAYLDTARRDPDYKFVLAELDYLKPYWDAFPDQRGYLRQLIAEGRLELMGGTYNEPNTNLTSAETTARSAVYGIGYQRHVLGGAPATAWQLDVFGHDPQFPGMMADAGLSSSSWARGPFHEWGPLRSVGDNTRMQFASEFDWVSPSGRSLLTSYMPNHYSAGWDIDKAVTLEEAEVEAYRLFGQLKPVAATRNVLLPVGTDYTPPNKWITEIHRDWNRRYVWPKFVVATPSEFFAAVRADAERAGHGFSPQTRDMNPVYTGKDVSYIDTKQAQRAAENAVLDAEKFGTVAALLGARYPAEALDKAWRQLLYGAHHDGITGSESDQVYLDLIGGWREAVELGEGALEDALAHLCARIDTAGEGRPVVVFNPLTWPRTDVTRFELTFDAPGPQGIALRDDTGADVAFHVEAARRHDDGSLAWLHGAFVSVDVPAMGYRTYRVTPSDASLDDATWQSTGGHRIANDRYVVEVDAERGGAVSRLFDQHAEREMLKPDQLGNELLAYDEYPQHPRYGEGPWHLIPNGTVRSSTDFAADVTVETSPIAQRITVTGTFHHCVRTQQIVLFHGVDRVDFRTHLDGFSAQDMLFRVRFAADVEGGMPVSEVGNAVVGRGFGFPNVDVADVAYILDYPAYNWFGVGATLRVALADDDGRVHASRAVSVAEVVCPDEAAPDAARDLVTALVRRGVTSTVSVGGGSRYGSIDVDSNLPDVRVAVGGPDQNRFTAEVLDAADPAYRAELDRQLAKRGTARVWVPARAPLSDVWQPNVDLRGPRELPVLIVAGADAEATEAARQSLTDDLDGSVVTVTQSAALDGHTGQVADYGVAVLNRGTPGCNVDTGGDLYLSLMRASSGWPAGVWLDPPRRTVPDGSSFQFQHWSHTFDYAVVGHAGDWRAGGVVRQGHEYNHPLPARVVDPHRGELPVTLSFAGVVPAGVVVTALKPAGNPLARMAEARMDPRDGIAVRAYESQGGPAQAELRFFRPLRDGFVTDLLEDTRAPLPVEDGALRFDLDGYGIATVGAVPEHAQADSRIEPVPLGLRAEPAQPVFADYWLHNRGAAPLGYQPVTVGIGPRAIESAGAFTVPVGVASERTDRAVAGRVLILAPAGWRVDPDERLYRLAPGDHLDFDCVVTTAPDAAPGRYFVAARITDEAGQTHEDVVTVDYRRSSLSLSPAPEHGARSLVVDKVTRKAAIVEEPPISARHARFGGELSAELVSGGVTVAPGERARLDVVLRNRVAGEIRGEAQVLSPYGTWDLIRPGTQGFVVAGGGETVVTFTVTAPPDARPAAWWALVKVGYFGRVLYTQAVEVRVDARHGGVGSDEVTAAGHGIRSAPDQLRAAARR